MKNNQKRKKQRLSKILKNNCTLLLKAAKATPVYFAASILEGVVWGMINSAYAIFTLELLNALDAGSSFEEMARIILIMAGFYVVVWGLDAWYWQYYQPLQRQKLSNKLNAELFLKAHSLDVACYDDPEFYNDFVWAMDEAGNRANELLGDLGKLVNRMVAGGTLFALLFSIDTVVAALLLVSSALSVVVYQIGNKISFEHEKEAKPLARKRDYLNRVFHLPEYAKELRTSHVTDLLMDEMDENTDKIVALTLKYGKKYMVLYGVFNNLLRNGVYFGVLFYMLSQLMSGAVLVGSFAATIGMIWRVRWLLSDFIERLTKFPKHSLFLEKYYGFLSYEPKIRSGGERIEHFESLELRGVSFSYDFSDKPRFVYHDKDHKTPEPSDKKEALQDVSLTLSRGEKIAIVGYNGAGKTTLIKLLLRMYDATEGEVLLNGRSISEYELESYKELVGVVFQDYKIFAASIAENVTNGFYDKERDEQRVLRALDAAGFSEKLASLEGGLDTQLTREFDPNGTNLSGGESQKVAIARVFAHPYELIIMDEPSSALDPMAEYELNHSILEYARDKTVIFISHRLSTTRIADKIYMFDQGRLIECGSHDQLMARGGKYAEMFELQAQKYRENAITKEQ